VSSKAVLPFSAFLAIEITTEFPVARMAVAPGCGQNRFAPL
jgi:hypothetical protein